MSRRTNLLAGSSCADDFDGCQDNPCTKHTNCTDLTPPEHVKQKKAYKCSECPKGFYDDDGTCIGSCDHIPYSITRNVLLACLS